MRTTKLCTAAAGSSGQHCRPAGLPIWRGLFHLRGAGAEVQFERWQREARQYREAWTHALVTVLAHALLGRLRHISQVDGWSAPSLSPLIRGAVVAIAYFVFAKGSLTLA